MSPSRPRVLFVTRKWAPAVGGMETYCHELTDALADHAEVETLALPGRPDGTAPGALALIGFGLRAMARIATTRRLPEVLHLADMAIWPLALPAMLRRRKPLVVLSAHGTDASYPRRGGLLGGLYGAYLSLGARWLAGAKVIANSRATAAAIAERGWFPEAPVPLATRARPLPVPEGHAPHLLFAGRLIRQKGCRWLVEHVLPHLPQVITLRIAGTVWDEDERAAIDDPRVTFLGPLSREALEEEYRAALAVVMPNLALPSGEFEGFGLVAVEAAAAGGVVLAADFGGLADAVVPGETGFLLPPGDADVWADAIVRIADWTASDRRVFIAGAMDTARAHFDWARVARQTAAIYGMAR